MTAVKSVAYNISVMFMLLFSAAAIAGDGFEKLLEDMTLPNEAPLLNPPTGPTWVHRGSIAQGGVPRGDATPPWWQPYDSSNLKSSAYWNAASPWLVIYPGKENDGSSVRFIVDSLEVYLLVAQDNQKTIENAQWQQVESENHQPSWAGYYGHNLIDWKAQATARTEPDGSHSYSTHPYASWPIHAGMDKFVIDGSRVLNIFIRVKAYVAMDDGECGFYPESSQHLIAIGVDYYPTVDSQISDFAPTGYNPGVGMSRFSLLSTTPRWHHFVAMNPPGYTDEPSDFQKNNGLITISEEQLRQNPPPPLR